MAKKSKREKIEMRSSESPFSYTTVKNKQNTPEKLTMRRYDPVVRKHVEFKEGKIAK